MENEFITLEEKVQKALDLILEERYEIVIGGLRKNVVDVGDIRIIFSRLFGIEQTPPF